MLDSLDHCLGNYYSLKFKMNWALNIGSDIRTNTRHISNSYISDFLIHSFFLPCVVLIFSDIKVDWVVDFDFRVLTWLLYRLDERTDDFVGSIIGLPFEFGWLNFLALFSALRFWLVPWRGIVEIWRTLLFFMVSSSSTY